MFSFITPLRVIYNWLRFSFLKFCGYNISCKGSCTSRLDNEYRISRDGTLIIGYHLASLSRCRFLVAGGKLIIHDNVGVNTNCIIACHERVEIGKDVEIGPNVCIYDHDHDFLDKDGIKAGRFKTAPVLIGERTWIGANVIILKGTEIGKDCVIGAGCIVKGVIPDSVILTQKRQNDIRAIDNKKNQ